MMWDVGTQWRSAEIQTGRKPAVVTWCLVPEYEIGRSSPKRGARLFFLTFMQCSHSMQREGTWLCIGLELETSLWSYSFKCVKRKVSWDVKYVVTCVCGTWWLWPLKTWHHHSQGTASINTWGSKIHTRDMSSRHKVKGQEILLF